MSEKQELDPELFKIGDLSIGRGKKKYFDMTVARLYDYTELSLPICVIRGKKPGPIFFISGAVHGDEIIGTEIIKRLLTNNRLKIQFGTLILIPIVNVFGYNSKSRYLPDRRDLNRSFPGNPKGSLSSRLAHIFLDQIVAKCHYGIDLHSAAVHRSNLPQIRACLDDEKTEEFAMRFGAPVIINSKIRDGSIRAAAEDHGVSILVFEGGEALRHDENVIKLAIRGIFRCLKHVGMIRSDKKDRSIKQPFIAKSSYWVRAPQSGVFRGKKSLGSLVEQKEELAIISDVFSQNTAIAYAQKKGVIIGENRLPLLNQGDAMYHIATFEKDDFDQMPDDLPDYVD